MTRPMALLVAGGLLMGAAGARGDEDKSAPPTIAVEGTGRIAAPPDVADVQVGVVTQAATAREALAANNAAMAALHEARGGVASPPATFKRHS